MQDMFAVDGVAAIKPSESHWLLLNKHYAKRLPVIQFAYGLWRDGHLAGVVTYGPPAASPVRTGMLGPDCAHLVIELNRLCLDENVPHMASHLVGRSLRLLPKPKAVISYADTAQGHMGTIYQAANFLYCGLSAKRTDWALRGADGAHGQSIADTMRGVPDRAAAMRARYGEDFYLSPRSRKHRYVYLAGSKRQRRDMLAALRYQIEPYPHINQHDTPHD